VVDIDHDRPLPQSNSQNTDINAKSSHCPLPALHLKSGVCSLLSSLESCQTRKQIRIEAVISWPTGPRSVWNGGVVSACANMSIRSGQIWQDQATSIHQTVQETATRTQEPCLEASMTTQVLREWHPSLIVQTVECHVPHPWTRTQTQIWRQTGSVHILPPAGGGGRARAHRFRVLGRLPGPRRGQGVLMGRRCACQPCWEVPLQHRSLSGSPPSCAAYRCHHIHQSTAHASSEGSSHEDQQLKVSKADEGLRQTESLGGVGTCIGVWGRDFSGGVPPAGHPEY